MIFSSLLSSGGLPPFLGLLPNSVIIQATITNNIDSLATIVVVTSLINLDYLKISYSSYTFEHRTKMKFEFPQN